MALALLIYGLVIETKAFAERESVALIVSCIFIDAAVLVYASMAVQPARADCPAGHRCVAAAGLAEVCRRLALHRTAFRRPRPLPQPAWPAELLS